MDDDTKPEDHTNPTPEQSRPVPNEKDKVQRRSEPEGKTKSGELGEKESNIILGLKKRFGWKYIKVKPDGTRKEHHFTSRTGLEIKNISTKDIRSSCEWLIDEISKGLAHLRLIGGKEVDNKENGSLLKGSSEIKEEHALHTKPKEGSEMGYTKGPDSEIESNPKDGSGTSAKTESDKTERTGKPEKTETDNREKGPGSGEPNDD